MDLNVLGLGGLGDENIGEEDGEGEENDDDHHALLQPTLGLAHPGNALIFFFLGTLRGAPSMMMVRHRRWMMYEG